MSGNFICYRHAIAKECQFTQKRGEQNYTTSEKKSVERARDTNETVNNSECIYITSGNE